MSQCHKCSLLTTATIKSLNMLIVDSSDVLQHLLHMSLLVSFGFSCLYASIAKYFRTAPVFFLPKSVTEVLWHLPSTNYNKLKKQEQKQQCLLVRGAGL